LHRPVETAPYFRHYDIDLGSSFGRITSVLPTILKLSVRY
jgi:hypothetical protein